MTQHLNTKLVVAMMAAAAAASVYAQWENAKTSVLHGRTIYFDTPTERCLARGAGEFDDRHEWPVTFDGREARDEIVAACAVDVAVFGADDPEAEQR